MFIDKEVVLSISDLNRMINFIKSDTQEIFDNSKCGIFAFKQDTTDNEIIAPSRGRHPRQSKKHILYNPELQNEQELSELKNNVSMLTGQLSASRIIVKQRNKQLADYKNNTLISRKTASNFDKRLSDYCNNKQLRKRWAKVLIDRALRIYCNEFLDNRDAEQYLYQDNENTNIYDNLDFVEKNEIEKEF